MPTSAQVHEFLVTYQLPLYATYCVFVGSLRAPTVKSSQAYVSLFAVLNFFAANLGRMFPEVERSPNFEAAVTKKINGSGNGGNGGTTAPHA